MRDTNLVNALRCASTAGGTMGDCEEFPFHKTEPVPEELVEKVNLTEWSSCDVDAVGLAAADQLENQSAHIAALQQEIEKLRGQLHRWIPVEERLPENGVETLCWYEYFRYGDFNAMFATYGIGYQFHGNWGGEVANGRNAKVLAWMPLPEPPEVENAETE